MVGSVRYDHLLPLRSDIMGPFAYVPMETKHTVFSMRHQVTGSIRLNGDALDIRNGIGYMEGDRGHTFPRSYFWMQCLDVRQDASVMLAIAEIPLGPIRFTGCIGIVALGETEYRFATYRGVRIVEHTPTMAEVRQGDMSLRVEVLDDRGHKLQAPAQGLMDRTIHESPSVPARIRFVKGRRTSFGRDGVPNKLRIRFPRFGVGTGRPLCVPRGADPPPRSPARRWYTGRIEQPSRERMHHAVRQYYDPLRRIGFVQSSPCGSGAVREGRPRTDPSHRPDH